MRTLQDREVVAIAIEHIETVIHRLMQDSDFRVRYCQDPDAALRAYLTPTEIRAIKTGDGSRLGLHGQSSRWHELSARLCGTDPGP